MTTRRLSAAGFDEAVPWVHPDNERARRLYEAAGWLCDEVARREEIYGFEVPEVRYRRRCRLSGVANPQRAAAHGGA